MDDDDDDDDETAVRSGPRLRLMLIVIGVVH